MAASPNANPVASDGGRTGARAWNRGFDNRFEWVASSPSPAEVEALERRFPEVIQIPAGTLEEASSDWRLKAVIARSLSRWIPPEAIVREFRRAGVAGEVEAVSLAHRHYFFRFSDPSAKEIALSRPWMANGQVIAVEDWRAEFVPSEGALATALVWIRLPSLPLEFWAEEIVGSILSAAGTFQFIDDATRERKRGSFARACVRVDLSKSLRPGVRVCGSSLPFWQQFVYEHLEGICVTCGSVHPAGSCLSSSTGASSSDNPAFGPWMAALRRRRPPHQSSEAAPASKAKHATAVPQDGWQSPKKFARRLRRPAVSGSEGLRSELQAGDGRREMKSGELRKSAEAGSSGSGGKSVAVPVSQLAESTVTGKAETESAVPVHSIPTPVSEFPLKQASVSSDKPFAKLSSDNSADMARARKGTNPGPLKRARPVDYPVSRVVSKPPVKGKGKIKGKSAVHSSLIVSVPVTELNGPVTFQGSGPMVNRTREVQGSENPTETPQMMREEGRSHDSVVSLLRQAIQPKATVEAMDSSDQCPLEGVIPVCGSAEAEMSGVVVPPPPSE